MRLLHGQIYREPGTLAHSAMDHDRPAMTDDDPVRDGESETGTLALRLSGEKRLEDMFLHVFAHPNAVVAAVDSHKPSCFESQPVRCLDIEEQVLGRYCNRASAITDRIDRIGY